MTTVRNPSASISTKSQSVMAVTVAVRASPVSSDISPNTSPLAQSSNFALRPGKRHGRFAANDDEERPARAGPDEQSLRRAAYCTGLATASNAVRSSGESDENSGADARMSAPTTPRTGTTPPSSGGHLHLDRVRDGDVVALERVVNERPHEILRALVGLEIAHPESHAIHNRRIAEVDEQHFRRLRSCESSGALCRASRMTPFTTFGGTS